MSFRIRCDFDPESGRSGIDPLGKLVISDGQSEILIAPTFFDSWLAALIDALERLRSSDHANVEVSEEAEPILVEVSTDGHLVFSHKDRKVIAEGPKEFENALFQAAKSFLDELQDSPDVWRNRFIDPIRRFVMTSRN